jgi:putative Mg2+ transporter-C (MgtC) family protein
MSDLVVLQRLLLVTAIAGAIGFERERHGRAAGFRTHILVGLGSCLMMLTGLHLMEAFAGVRELDPTRIAAQVVSGIGFLGAGTILRFRASVRGLTTAASLWAVAGIGLAVGAGFLWGALVAGLIVVVVLFGFSGLERAMRRDWYGTLMVETSGSAQDLGKIRGLLAEYEIEIRDVDIRESGPGQLRMEFQVKLVPDQPREEILKRLLQVERVSQARWSSA